MAWLRQFLADVLVWLLQAVEWFLISAFKAFLTMALGILEWMPVPEWFISLDGSEINSGIAWGLNICQVPAGLSFIGTALVMRFILRRIPGIGG